MPRQPLMYVKPKAKVRFAANALGERPELAALVGECIGFWSQVEAQLANLLSAIMKTETAIPSAVFLSIRNSRAQRECPCCRRSNWAARTRTGNVLRHFIGEDS